MRPEHARRRQRIADGLATTVKGETITLEELALIWGVGKPAFVNVRNTIADFPNPTVDGKAYFYERRVALESLDRHERRGDQVAKAKSDRINALLGLDEDAAAAPSVSELQKLSQLRAEIESRMRDQGQLILIADVQASFGRLFEILSRPLSNLGTVIDPNGKWPADIREEADRAGELLLLQLHAEVKDKLAPNAAAPKPARNRTPRKPAAKPGPTGAPRQRGKRAADAAGHAQAADGGVDKRVVKRTSRNQRAK